MKKWIHNQKSKK